MVGRFLRGVRLAVVDALLFIWLMSRLAGNQATADCPENRTRMNADERGFGEGCVLFSVPYAELITQTAQRHGLEPALLAGLVQVESNFNPRAVSGAGAMGLTQIMPETAKGLGLERPFDVAANLDAGARYLAWLIMYFEGDVNRAIMAYHGGPGRVAGGGQRPIDEQYLAAVLAAREVFSGQFQLPYPVWANARMTQDWHGVAGYEGTDWAAGCGTPLVASLSGVVTYNGLDGYNHVDASGRVWPQSTMLVIEGSGGVEVVLLHGAFTAVVGQEVVAGVTVVGFEDRIGWATGCHTHVVLR